MAVQDYVGVVALLVSLVALIIAVGQLLQQVFGTAEGYRSCNASVIGPWSKTRHRVLHIGELRMETRFQTPELTLVEDTSDGIETILNDPSITSWREPARAAKKGKSYVYLIDGSQKSLESTYVSDELKAASRIESKTTLPFSEPVSEKVSSFSSEADANNSSKGNPMSMAVGWLTFLQKLHEHEMKYEGLIFDQLPFKDPQSRNMLRTKPAIRRIQRSWDFMPTDAVRPLASTQFGDLLILCYRMRIRWYDLQLGQRRLRAEGFGHSFTLIDVRGLGFVLEYRFGGSNLAAPRNDGNDHAANRHFVPSKPADKLAFGLIPTDDKLVEGHEHLDLGGEDYFTSIVEMHEALGVGPATLEDFHRHQNKPPDEYFHVSNEALYLLAPFIPLHDVGAVKIQPPFRHRFGSICTFREGRLVFHYRLKRLLRSESTHVSTQLQHVYDVLDHLASNVNMREEFRHWQGFKHRTFAKNARNSKTEAKDILTYLHHEFDKTTEYLQKTLPFGCYTDLVASHLEMALKAHKDAKSKEVKKQRIDADADDLTPWMTEAAHLYVDRVESGAKDSVCDSFRKRYEAKRRMKSEKDFSTLDHSTVSDAWWTMMLRSFLWDLSVLPINSPGLPMPSHLYGDTTPVWIA
ncbi:MAG: hypothetical protein Q9160_006155 [Pyrenula sp. 1 TL-2023]